MTRGRYSRKLNVGALAIVAASCSSNNAQHSGSGGSRPSAGGTSGGAPTVGSGGQVRLTDADRRRLAVLGKKMGGKALAKGTLRRVLHETSNRCLVVVKAKSRFVDWIKGLPEPLDDVTLASVLEDSHVYLLSEYETDEMRSAFLRRFYEEIFEEELMGWCTDERTYPARRTLAMFREWFDVEFHSVVFDMDDDESEHELL